MSDRETVLEIVVGDLSNQNRELYRQIKRLQEVANVSEAARRDLAEQVRVLSAIVGAINMGAFLEKYQAWQKSQT